MKIDYRLNSRFSFIKVLIIENVAYSKRLLKKDFKNMDFFVLTTSNGEGAIKKIGKYNPDIITIGHEPPDMSISLLLKRIRSISHGKIVFISSRAATDILSKDDFPYLDSTITLPKELHELKKIISDLLN